MNNLYFYDKETKVKIVLMILFLFRSDGSETSSDAKITTESLRSDSEYAGKTTQALTRYPFTYILILTEIIFFYCFFFLFDLTTFEPISNDFLNCALLSQLKYFLCDADIDEDLAIINKITGRPMTKKIAPPLLSPSSNPDFIYEARIDDGRLYYEKKW